MNFGNATLVESYARVRDAFESDGWQFYDNRQIKGKTKQHPKKPDFIATKDNILVIGEVKSGTEMGVYQSSYRQIQPSDSEEFARVRCEVAEREKKGLVEEGVGKHEIVICGQLDEYRRLAGITYDFPAGLDTSGKYIMAGYSVPASEEENVEKALINRGKRVFAEIDSGNWMLTYILDF